MEALGLTPDMIAVLCLLVVTVFLFVSEIVRVDVAAIIVMVALGLLSQFPGMASLGDPRALFEGFASNAVISIMAVMIIGAGLDKTGLMSTVARWILKAGGSTPGRIIPLISSTVGVISSFMQNVGAAALFLPVVSRISSRADIPLSQLLMPMGFCAILGGTMTLIGSSPLILLNDLIIAGNQDLPADRQMETFGLFAVTPIGICLILAGIIYFMVFGRFLLPGNKREGPSPAEARATYLNKLYGLESGIAEVFVPENSSLEGRVLMDLHTEYGIYIIAMHDGGKPHVAPVVLGELKGPCTLALMGSPKSIRRFVVQNDLTIHPRLELFQRELAPHRVGVAELVIPPGSTMIGKSVREVRTRAIYGFSLLAIYRRDEVLSHMQTEDHEVTAIGFEPLQAGDTLVIHTTWEALNRLQQDRNFVIITTDYPRETLRPQKLGWAVFFFAAALSLVLFTDILLSLCLLTGAIGMIVSRVVRIDEAYEAISWNTVFLLASLIPLGRAVQDTGTAEWIATGILQAMGDVPIWVVQAGIGVLATAFTLIMSNVGATVLLVPLAINLAIATGGDPAIFALTVAICTSNSFLIPTHQVNALIMGPAGYRVKDFLRVGAGMTVLFLLVALPVMNFVF